MIVEPKKNSGPRKINVRAEEVAKIFDPSHRGGVYFDKAIDESLLERLRKDIESIENEGKFFQSSKKEKRGNDINYQNFKFFYIDPEPGKLGSGSYPESELQKLPAIRELAEGYTGELYNRLAELTKLFPKMDKLINSIAVNTYEPVNGHIGYHKDDPYNEDIITAFHINGEAASGIALTKLGEKVEYWKLKPGGMTCMRAPSVWMATSAYTTWPLRPWHYIETGAKKKITLLFRHVNVDTRRTFDPNAPIVF